MTYLSKKWHQLKREIEAFKHTPRFKKISWPNAGAPIAYDFDLSGTKVQIKAPIAMGQIAKRNQIHSELNLDTDLVLYQNHPHVDGLVRHGQKLYETGYVLTEGRYYFDTAAVQNLNLYIYELVGEVDFEFNFFNLEQFKEYVFAYCQNKIVKHSRHTDDYNPYFLPERPEEIEIIGNTYLRHYGDFSDYETRYYPIGKRRWLQLEFARNSVQDTLDENGDWVIKAEMKRYRQPILDSFKYTLSPEAQAEKDEALAALNLEN